MEKTRTTTLTVAIVGACILGALFRFNAQYHGYEEYLVTNIGALLWLPMVVIFLVLRQEPTAFGFGLGSEKRGLRLAGLLFLLVLPFLVLASRWPQYQDYYPIQKSAEQNWPSFAYFELTYGMYMFCWEFFFRGFLLFGLFRSIGAWSVFVQAAAFGIMHWGKPEGLFAPLVAGTALGLLALRSKSFVPCFVLHWVCSLAFDVLVIAAKPGGLF